MSKHPHERFSDPAGPALQSTRPESALPRVIRTLSSDAAVKMFLSEITPDRPYYSRESFRRLSVNLKWHSRRTKIMDAPVNNTVFTQAAVAHIDALYGYAMALTRDSMEAEDLVQETYLRATRATNQPDLNGNLKAWLFVIMRNAWLNHVRHDQNGPRFVELDTNEQSDETRGNPHVVYLRKLEREQVRAAIEKLPQAYREIVVLRDIEGFSYQEIAMVLDCPAGTVMSRLGRARAKLRDSLSTWQARSRARAV